MRNRIAPRQDADAKENYHGSVSPAEEFVLDCLAGYGARDYTPQDAREELEQFEESFNNAIENTRYLLERYRGEIEGNNANVPEEKD